MGSVRLGSGLGALADKGWWAEGVSFWGSVQKVDFGRSGEGTGSGLQGGPESVSKNFPPHPDVESRPRRPLVKFLGVGEGSPQPWRAREMCDLTPRGVREGSKWDPILERFGGIGI